MFQMMSAIRLSERFAAGPLALLRRAGLVLVLVLGGVAALADQRDARLDGLFEALGAAGSPARAAPIEAAIWAIWSDSGDARIDDLMALGTAAMLQGRLTQAIALFTDVVARRPDFAEGWNKRATALYYAGRADESVADIQRTLALEPRHFGALSGMGLIFLQRRDHAGALVAFEQVLSIHPAASQAREQVRVLRERLAGRQAQA